MVEAAFPVGAIFQFNDRVVNRNTKLISELGGKRPYTYGGILVTGSRAEGLALEDTWGHPPADTDVMKLEGSEIIVRVPRGHRNIESPPCLTYRPKGCPAGYTKLEVLDIKRLSRAAWRWWHGSCVYRHRWLSTYTTMRRIMKEYGGDSLVISGPAGQGSAMDTVPTLVCNSPHPEIEQEFCRRPRGQWPPTSLIDMIRKLVMLLVLVGHKHSSKSEFRLQARLSWSACELALIRELPGSVRQGYIASKYVLKRFLAICRGQNEVRDGRSCVSSYHIKTALLHFLEKNPQAFTISPFRLFLDLLYELNVYIEMGNLPHYFLTQCNLLETVGEGERRLARQAIGDILIDPLHALLTSSTNPQEIYGTVRPEELVIAFRKVSTHPACERDWKYLSGLLTCVDECRQRRYQELLARDANSLVFGRTKMVGLVDAMNQINPH